MATKKELNSAFAKFETANGTHIGLFLMCAATNTICLPLLVPEDFAAFKGDKWGKYLKILKDNGKSDKTFFDGETDIRKVFGKNLTENDFGKYVAAEKQKLEYLPGTPEQREFWGVSKDYNTTEAYNELDRQYQNRLESYNGTTLTPQMEDTLQKVCVWNYLIERYIEAGNIRSAKELQTMVETALASEQMRKKDEKPVEALRIDALINALEGVGLMEKGQFLNYDETVEALRDNFVKSKKYDYSLDVADQVILDILNSMRTNADLPLLEGLPEDFAAEDIYGEFETEETEKEKEAKRYAGLTKVPIISNGTDKGETE